MWSEDDDVSAFSDSDGWLEALDDRTAPTTFVKCETGGHRVDSMLEDLQAAQALRSFTAAALLVGELEQVRSEANEKEERRASGASASERAGRLSSELPQFLQEKKDTGENGQGVKKVAKDAKRLSIDIQHWIQAGMTTSSE
jgi:hypothetical protein